MFSKSIVAAEGIEMRLFARKPSRALVAEFVKQANGVLNIFGYALQRKTTNPAVGDDALDLMAEENRDAIRDELVRIIREYRLEACKGGRDRRTPYSSGDGSVKVLDHRRRRS